MNRLELLNASLSEEKDVKVLSKGILSKDKRFLSRHIRNLEDIVEDIEVRLEERLSSDIPVDKSVLELYSQHTIAVINLESAKDFKEKYL